MDQFGIFCLVVDQQQQLPSSLGTTASCLLRTHNMLFLENRTPSRSRLQDVYRR